MGREQSNALFVFDEPTIGLHPLDVRTLLNVFQQLLDLGATVVVIEHDLDVIRNADYIVDMGPGGGIDGGRIVAAKKSIANFRLREGMSIGAKVTLRGDRMYDFLDKLINVSLPRVRDFRGISSRSFDGRGNYTLGIKEQLIFPEIDYDKVNRVRGLDVVIVTTANTDEEARELLTDFGMPFTK